MGNIQSEPQEVPQKVAPNSQRQHQPPGAGLQTHESVGSVNKPSPQAPIHGSPTDSMHGSQLKPATTGVQARPAPAPTPAATRRSTQQPTYIAQRNDQRYGEIKILQYPDTKEMIAVKTTTFQDSGDYEQLIKLCKDYKTKDIHNIIQVIDYKIQADEGLCSNMYVVTITYEYLDRDLKRDITERSATQNYYREDELYNLIGNVAEGISSLLKFGGVHGDVQPRMVLLGRDGGFKLTDVKFMTNSGSAFQQLMLNHYGADSCYLSKELFETLKYQELNPQHDPVQNDVFALGLTALHAANLDDIQQVYNFHNFTFNKMELENMIQRASERYSPQLIALLKSMLEIYLNERIGIDGIISQCSLHKRGSIHPQPVRSPERNNEMRNSVREHQRPTNTSPGRNSFLNPGSATYQPVRNNGLTSAKKQLDTENSPIQRLDGSIIKNEQYSPEKPLSANHNNESYLKASQHTSPNTQRMGDSKYPLNDYQPNNGNNMERSLIQIDKRVREALNLSKETQKQYELSPVKRFREQLLSDEVYVPLNTSADVRQKKAYTSLYKNPRPIQSNLSSKMATSSSNQSVSKKPWVKY